VSVTFPDGFVASGVACGIKPSRALDLALVASAERRPVPAAAVFTTNLAAAAPVVVSRRHLDSTGGRAAAVVLNSGNANAATGAEGCNHAWRTAEVVALLLGVDPHSVLVCSTGLIGIPLPFEAIASGVGELVERAGGSADDALRCAQAIMTTDTHPKQAAVRHPSGFKVGAMAKGAAMLAPSMATMLAVVTTDAVASPDELAVALGSAVDSSFNRLIVDACTSTNDTVLVLASGASGVHPSTTELTAALGEVCHSLAEQMANDAEGATKVAHVTVQGAASEADALAAARKVASSLLVKCSLHGEDPYWGRIVSELGSSGAAFDLERVSVSYGGTKVCENGVGIAHDEKAVRAHMAGRLIEIVADLGIGEGSASVTGTDISHAYIDENVRTS